MIEDRIEEKIEARKERRRERKSLEGTMKWVMNISTVLGLAVMGWFAWYCYRQGIFQSQDALEGFLHGFGFWAPVIFTLVQGIQVVLPILPGAIGCLAGVLVFGPVWGFIYNYIGICVGSLCAFLLARRFGAPFVRSISNPKTYEKYIGWLEKGNRFDRFFALAIFLPVAPDDFLCYLAGLTRMSFKKMTLIILLGKPASIALYSLGLYTIGLKALSLLQ
ncbi:MAG: TVP38/TMEM64 family protein [Lachnospiraceae bacterium]|nr:TVP38/TMEM64 family protein [Lachnospiraceae bacterium]